MAFDPAPTSPRGTRYRSRGVRLPESAWAGLALLRGATGLDTAALIGPLIADALARVVIPPDARERARWVALRNLRRGQRGPGLIGSAEAMPPERSRTARRRCIALD